MRTDEHEKRGFWILLALGLAAFYLGFAILDGYHIYPDSTSYITMDESREPLYSLFLALVRRLFGAAGPERWLQAAALIQSLINAWACLFFARTCSRELKLGRLSAGLVALCTILPSIMCRFLAKRGSMYSYSIITESLALPLYLAFFACMLAWTVSGRRGALLRGALLAFLLISIRKQMYITLPLLLLCSFYRGLREHAWLRRTALALLLSAAVLFANTLLDRGYNLALRGEAVRHTGDMRFVTTMLLYTAQESDADTISDPGTRALFEAVYRAAYEDGDLRRFAPEGWFARSLFFNEHYDRIQFDCLKKTEMEFIAAGSGADGLAQELEKDRMNDALNAALLPLSWGRLAGTFADSFAMGLVTSVMTMRPRLILPTLLLYAAFAVLLIGSVALKRRSEAELGFLTLAAIGVNVGLVALTIFCQSRYTIYNMPCFYAALWLMLRGCLCSLRQRRGAR